MKTSEDIVGGEFLIPEPFNRLNDAAFTMPRRMNRHSRK